MKKSIIRCTCFIFILITVLGCVNHIFKFKYSDGIYGVTKFYELDNNTVDVLILGSSHAFQNFNTGKLWDEYGMASYILGGSVQPMWNTYYYLKEALKTQKPELIILEGYMVKQETEYMDDSRIIKNNYGLHWSSDKINSIKISSPKERWMEFLLEYTQYHTRYTELSKADFLPNQGNRLYDNWKGFGCNMATTVLEANDISNITDSADLYDKTEKYYRQTIELAIDNSIPIIVVVTPYASISEKEQKQYNTASEIAAEYDVPFVNCNLLLEEIGIDFKVDAADSGHLNYRGNQKFSTYIGKYIKSIFEISNRYGDSRYESWQANAEYIRQMIANQELLETSDCDSIVEKIQNPGYWLFISVDGNCSTGDENLQHLFSALEIPMDGTNGIWCRTNEGIGWRSQNEEAEQYIRTSAHDFWMKRTMDESGDYLNVMVIDNTQYRKVSNGVNIIVYDTVTEKIADMFGINMDKGYSLTR